MFCTNTAILTSVLASSSLHLDHKIVPPNSPRVTLRKMTSFRDKVEAKFQLEKNDVLRGWAKIECDCRRD